MFASDKALSEAVESKPAQEAIFHLRTIVESSNDAILSASLDGTILSWNRAAEQLFGYAPEAVIEKSIALLLPADEVPDVLDRIGRGAAIAGHPVTITSADGASVDVSMTLSPIVNASEELIGASVTLRDITEVERTKETLTRLAKVFTDAADPIIIEDIFGRIVDLNPEAEAAYGYTRDELLGQSIKTIIPPQQHEQADQIRQRCRQNERVRNVETVRQNKSGKNIPVLLTLSLVTNEFAKPTAIVTIGKNISEQKRTETQLRKAVDELKRLNEELDDFVAVVSHDLRAPLITISGFSEIVSHECEEQMNVDKVMDCVERIGKGANRAVALLESLRDYSRVGKVESKPENVDLNEVVAATIELLRQDIQEHDAEVEVGELPVVSGDRMRLIQLLQNLIANAIKFSGDKKPAVKISASREDDMWRISVQDNGIGIDAEHQDQIFAAFRRLHSQREYEGSGVGLATCRKIVEQHDGRIWVESEPGKGATFHFTLPAASKSPATD